MTRLFVLSAAAPAGLRDHPCSASAGRESDVRVGLLDYLHDFPAIRCLADDFDILFKRQQLSETVTDDRVIVRQHYSNGLGL